MRDVNNILDVIKNGTITDEALYDYPETLHDIIPITLTKHQLQSIYAMNILENKLNEENQSEYIVTELGVLANKVGSGKSLCVLGLIAKQPGLYCRDVVKECHGDIFIMENRMICDVKPSNLIVVPHHLLRTVWIPYLRQTNLSFVVVTKDNVCNEDLREYSVVLCGAKYYNILMKHCKWIWSRVIFDEADTIHIPACVKPNTSFVWFITSSIQNLIFYQGYYWKYVDETLIRVTTRGIANQGYIKNTFRNLKECPLFQNIIIKFNDDYLNNCLNLPPIVYDTHRCQQPYYLRVVHDLVPESILSHIHGNDIDGAMEQIGCSVDVTTNIIAIILTQLNDKLVKHNLKSEYLLQLQNSISIDKDIENKIKKNNHCVNLVKEQIRKIHDRVSFVFNNELRHSCPICMDDTYPESTCIFSCCLNLFCTECVKKVIHHSITVCPLCRTTIEYSSIFKTISSDQNETKQLNSKNDTLMKLIIGIHNDFREYNVIIFAMYEESILSIQTTLYKSMVQFKTLRGNNIQNTLQWFDNSNGGVLLVNAQLHGSGLNMNKTTHIIMYQQFTPDLTMQLIGRAHRIGRYAPLYVHTLQY